MDGFNNQLEKKRTERATICLSDANATRSLGLQLGQVLPAHTVLLLQGDLGSGKTTFVQGLGEGLGVADPIDSPTFALINEYFDGRLPLYHFDLYRLNPAEAAALYPETYWEGDEKEPGIVAIEWSERLVYLPDNYLSLHFYYDNDSGRQVDWQTVGSLELAPLLARLELPVARSTTE